MVAIFSGWFQGDGINNYPYDESIHDPLEMTTIEHGPEGLLSDDVVTKWRDQETGEVYSFGDLVYQKHRSEQAIYVSIRAFLYGLLGCFAFALFGMCNESFFKLFGKAVLVNCFVALVLFFLA